MVAVKFYIGSIPDLLKDSETGTPNKLDAVNIYESSVYEDNDSYVLIDTQPLRITSDSITTTKAAENWLDKWYKLEFINTATTTVYGKTSPVVPEYTATIVDDIRMWFGDTNLDSPSWSDKEYVQAIRFAFRQFKGEKNLSYFREEDRIPVQLLVRIEFALILAYDHAKYYALQAPNATLDKSQIMTHYLEIVRSAEEHYNNIAKRLGLDHGGKNEQGIISEMPSPNIQNITRTAITFGGKVNSIDPTRYPRRNLL